MYPQYKSNRGPTPDTVVQGLQYLKASIKAMSIKVIEVTKLKKQLTCRYDFLNFLFVITYYIFLFDLRCLVLKLMML